MKKEDLIGKKVDELYIDSLKEVIKMRCGDEWVHLVCGQDCCSETWIEHVTGSERGYGGILGEVITSIEEPYIDVEFPSNKQEVDKVYLSHFRFGKGYSFSIEYRNASNGYYGGWLDVQKGNSDLEGFKRLEDF